MISPAGAVRVRVEGEIGWITLDRPERLNAFAGRMREELAAALEEVAESREIRVLVVTGAGRAFCAGADVDVMTDLLEREDEAAFAGFVEAGMRVVRAIRRAPQPVIAGLNGVAAGAGASLAAACDFRMMSDAASVGFTFSRIGLHPDWGATHFLPLLVGAGRAAELILSARMLDAAEAERIGFAQRVVPAREFEASLNALASELAAKPPLAVRHAKKTLASGDDGLEQKLALEAAAQMNCFRSADVREGIAAFREKRTPRFTGH